MEFPQLHGFVGQTTMGESSVADIPTAVNEIRITQLVRNYYPPIAGIVQFLSSGVTQGVLPDPDSARLIRITREIVDSFVTFGYAAIYADRRTHELDVVPPHTYVVLTMHEFMQVNGGRPPPREHIKRRNDERIIRSHVIFFPSSEHEELFFHPKFGGPLLFIGDWRPWKGIPTTPCHSAFEAMETRAALIRAAQIAARRSVQPAHGYVMSQPIGGMGSLLNSMAGLSSGIGPNDAVRLMREQTDALNEAHAEQMQKAQERLMSYSVDNLRADQISSVLEKGGDGHMAWVPRIEMRELDAGNELDLMASEVAYRYCIPPRVLNLRVVAMKSATTSIGDAAMGFNAISNTLCHTKHALDISRDLAVQIDDRIIVPVGELKSTLSFELIAAIEPVLSHKGRRQLYAETLRVQDDFISEQSIEEIKGQYLVKVAAERSKRAAEDDEPPAKRARPS
jgi:hypothetical protein